MQTTGKSYKNWPTFDRNSSINLQKFLPVTYPLVFSNHNLSLRKRKALPITETELKLIAAAAIIGLKSKPKNG